MMNIRQPLSSMAVFFKRASINIVIPEKMENDSLI